MHLNDFLFSYKTSIKSNIIKKKYFQGLRKSINFPYKFFLNTIRIFFQIRKINLDKLEKLKDLNLDELFIHFNTDKGSKVKILDKVQKGHNYANHYEKHLSKYKDKNDLKILEIGSLFGAGSASFLNYFNSANITCLDINPFNMKYHSKKIRTLFIDTQSKKIINDIANYIKYDFDIIIDDGSHNKKDQILTLNSFFPKLKKNGIYVVEDTTQYLNIPSLNDDNLDYGINDFIISLKKTGDHFSSYLSSSEKKKSFIP